MSHIAYRPLGINLKLCKPLITAHVEFLRACSVFLYLNYANGLGNEMKLRSKKGKIVFEPNGLKGRRIYCSLRFDRFRTTRQNSSGAIRKGPICFYYPCYGLVYSATCLRLSLKSIEILCMQPTYIIKYPEWLKRTYMRKYRKQDEMKGTAWQNNAFRHHQSVQNFQLFLNAVCCCFSRNETKLFVTAR